MVRDRTCHLLTVLGGAGVGKSRLVWEFAGGLAGDVTVLRGRCLPYGEGITYWPLAEIVREITRAEGRDPGEQSASAIAARLAGDEKAELIVERVAEALGLGGAGGATSEETFWAVRRLFEALARAGPLVIVVDDLHWAESTFLDLIEHVAEFSRDFPILLVCIARPELLDTRPGWGGDKLKATSIFLEPLSEAECRELISNLLDRAPLPPAAESRIAGAAEGNPLFAEELVAMLVDDALLTREGDRWVASSDLSELPVPSTIHALLAARLEGLPADERAILMTAAVEGAVFHRGAVGELRPTLDTPLEDGLLALVRRDLIRPDTADFAGEKAYRFRHGLIRDAAYRSLPKNARADLHERFAAWLELNGRGPAARVRGDRRLPPRTGLPVPCRARTARLARRLACRPGVRPARGGGTAGARPQRPARGDRPARAGFPAAPHRRSTADRAARRAGRRADRKRPAGRGRARARRGGAAGCRRGRPARWRRMCSSSGSSSGSSTARRAGWRRPRGRRPW